MSTPMTSSRPYLVRALYEWILDNGCTPHVVVDALLEGVEVPQEHVKDGQIVLNSLQLPFKTLASMITTLALMAALRAYRGEYLCP